MAAWGLSVFLRLPVLGSELARPSVLGFPAAIFSKACLFGSETVFGASDAFYLEVNF